jgi:hypothetical protein
MEEVQQQEKLEPCNSLGTFLRIYLLSIENTFEERQHSKSTDSTV